MKLIGTYTALITPFDSKYRLDEEGLRQNINDQLKHQVNGIVVLGTTGEAPTLTSEEKERIIKIAVEEIKGRTTLIVGTGSYSTAQTIESTQKAKELGADVALVIAPYYNKPTQEGLFRHFQSLCTSVSMPICVYNNGSRTSLNIQTETLKRIAKLPHIIAVKDSSGNLQQMNDIIEVITNEQTNLTILSGDDFFTFPLLSLGGHGSVSVIGNLVPSIVKSLVDKSLAGDILHARKLHLELASLFRGMCLETNPIPIKTAMQLCGKPSGPCRLPLCELQPENLEKLRHIVSQIPKEWIA